MHAKYEEIVSRSSYVLQRRETYATLCFSPGCYSNCHANCNDFSLDEDTLGDKCSAFRGRGGGVSSPPPNQQQQQKQQKIGRAHV